MFCLRNSLVLMVLVIAANSNAVGETVEELKQAGDLRGLVAKLGDHRAEVRRDAAVAMPGVAEKVKDPKTLDSVVGRLIDVRMRDPWRTTREYSGRALMYALNRTEDQVVLSNCVQPLVDALDQGEVDLERRRYAAVALSTVVMRLESVDLLRPRMTDLLLSALNDPDEGVRTYAERALQHTLQKLDHEPTLTIAVRPLAAQLESKDVHARGYAAVMLSGVVRKIKDPGTLKSLLGPITVAATKDPDKDVREYAGRAMRHIQNVLKEEKEPAAVATEKPVAKSDNPSATARNAIDQLKAKGDWRALVAKLNDQNPDVRQRARFALRDLLRDTNDESTLIPVMQTFINGLKDKDSTMRAYCAHGLHENVGKIDNQVVLARMLKPLADATATLQVTDAKSEGAEAGELAYFALRQTLEKVEDQTALKSIISPMTEALKAKEIKRRRYAAHTVMLFGHRVKDSSSLAPLMQPLVAAHFHDSDERVRVSAGMALKTTFGQVPNPL